MPAPIWDDLDQFMDEADFAEQIVFNLSGGRTMNVLGIFDEPYLNADIGEYEMDGTQPRVTAKATSLDGIQRGDTVRIDGVLYDVMGYPQPDGTGFAVVPLAAVANA